MKIDPDILQRCWFLAGPTASGKSAVGLELAERLGAEIVSLDSMALYRGMDIGTAKPDAAARQRIPHHLLDLLEPHQEFSVADYLRAADAACRDILARRRIPLFVGGTGLYLRAILRGVFAGPAADWTYRQQLETVAEEQGAEELHRRLREVDPAAGLRLHPHDLRRVIRALEVQHLTGRPLSATQQQAELPVDQRPPHVYWLNAERTVLNAAIDRRVEAMFAGGLVDEVRRLMTGAKSPGRTARQALGYREVFDHLAGAFDLVQTVARVQTHTRQFAKRQRTLFRGLVECRPVPLAGHETPGEIAQRLLSGG